MVDMLSRAQRSYVMSRVKGRGNEATELRLIAIFRQFGIWGWRRRAKVFGNPDFIFPEAHLAVFVDGCFWHSCPIHGEVPASNRGFWLRKLARNRERDRLVMRNLRSYGWHVIRIWQHELRNRPRVARRILRCLESSGSSRTILKRSVDAGRKLQSWTTSTSTPALPAPMSV